ncbi:MAG: hypothetical protein WC565_00425 [Parcubacteria group bacterium]
MFQVIILASPQFVEALSTDRYKNWKETLIGFITFAWPAAKESTIHLIVIKAEFIEGLDFHIEVCYTPGQWKYGRKKFNPGEGDRDHLYRVLYENLDNVLPGFKYSICLVPNDNVVFGTHGIIKTAE